MSVYTSRVIESETFVEQVNGTGSCERYRIRLGLIRCYDFELFEV